MAQNDESDRHHDHDDARVGELTDESSFELHGLLFAVGQTGQDLV